MKTLAVKDSLYGALEAAASRCGRSIQDLLDEAIESWLAEAAREEASLDESAPAVGGIESEPDEQSVPYSITAEIARRRASGLRPVDRVCGILKDSPMLEIYGNDVDAYIEDIRGR